MGRCRFRKIGCFLLCLFLVSPLQARCPMADKYAKENKEELEVVALNLCALQYNDDESQLKMAEGYMNGAKKLKKDEKMALFMYQLAAETGNAEAQVKLAELLQSFDTSPERRKELREYQKKLEKTSDDAEFSGEFQHPYTLLLLASERPENKWYYPSQKRAAPARAGSLLKNYKISPEKRQAATKDASKWKTRKLLEMAREILTSSEYIDFERKLKNAATRTEAMSALKNRLTGYVGERQKERLQSP